jgi:endonuclease-3
MTEQERANEVVARLHQAYPDAKCSLDFTTPLELLVATILAAQCTDDRVNMVTKTLFQKYQSAQDYAFAPAGQLEQDLKQINFYRNKAKNIQAMATILVNRYNGDVPRTMRELVALPGAARKTANVVLGNAFGIVEGVIVDTHCNRISRSLGFTTNDDPVRVEQELMKIVDRKDWLDWTHLLIYHGRAVCQARKPLCQQCVLLDLCPTGAANVAAAAAAPAPATKAKGKAKAVKATPASSTPTASS